MTIGKVSAQMESQGKKAWTGSMASDGKDGADGLGFDDMTARLAEDGSTVLFEWARGELVRQFPLTFPILVYRGVWKELEESGSATRIFTGRCCHARGFDLALQ